MGFQWLSGEREALEGSSYNNERVQRQGRAGNEEECEAF